jgi:hypothetical protein
MMEENNKNPKLVIPSLFYDSLSNAPFSRCQICEKELLESNSEYLIEKVFHKNIVSNKMEILFEYAICFSCAINMINSYSTESKENIQQFFMDHFQDYFLWKTRKRMSSELDIYEQLSTCAFSGKHVSELEEYQMVGHFKGGFLQTNELPFIMGGGSLDEITGLLSAQTLDEIDDFTGKYLTGPPELRDFFKSPKRRPVLI